jgi:hypothetical protein
MYPGLDFVRTVPSAARKLREQCDSCESNDRLVALTTSLWKGRKVMDLVPQSWRYAKPYRHRCREVIGEVQEECTM